MTTKTTPEYLAKIPSDLFRDVVPALRAAVAREDSLAEFELNVTGPKGATGMPHHYAYVRDRVGGHIPVVPSEAKSIRKRLVRKIGATTVNAIFNNALAGLAA